MLSNILGPQMKTIVVLRTAVMVKRRRRHRDVPVSDSFTTAESRVCIAKVSGSRLPTGLESLSCQVAEKLTNSTYNAANGSPIMGTVPNREFIMTVSYWLDAHKNKQVHEVDVAIIGGGIMGATAAYWLQKRKGLKVAVLESRTRGWGASSRNGGFVLRGIVAYYNQAVEMYGRKQAQWIFRLNEETLAHLSEFARAHGGDKFFFNNCGSYLLACTPEELQQLELSTELMREDGFEVEYLKSDPIERGYLGGMFNPCDIAVHSGLLVETVFEATGVTLLENAEVFRIESNADGSVHLHAYNHFVKASKVLLLTNAYAALMDPQLAAHIRPVRGQVVVTKPLSKRILNNLCYANYGYEYFRQLPDNRFLLGGCREPFVEQEVGFADMLTAPIQSALRSYIARRFPDISDVPIEYAWSGVMAFTQDGLPFAGQLSPNVYYALGCNGHGMGWSFALTKLLVEHVLDDREVGILGVERFARQPTSASAPA